MNRFVFCGLLFGAMLMSACGSHEPAEEPAPSTAAADTPEEQEPEQAAPPPPDAPNPAEIPVAEDFDREAERVVTATTYRAELTKLEKDIKQDPQ